MTRHVVIGTAGHVDHGKTALVQALTGVDTDRWAEEKRRGITIDLGFAPLALGDDVRASIVDVPGHEHFVRNMVAGATGVDVALLVVAADEGVMPQTVEHLAILEFLGVTTGVVAVSKIDLVEAEWLELVRADLVERLASSAIAWDTPLPVSVVTGAGLDELTHGLARAAARAAGRSDSDVFRLPVDRVFSVAGAGTVVTGTTWNGTVRVGDEVRLLPGDLRARVRGVEVHGVACDRAQPGRRTALALAGLERRAVRRGDVIVASDAWRPTAVLDVVVTLLPEARPLTQRSRVRLHLGTAEILARVTPAVGEIAPGTSDAARLRLERPIVARWGDRAVLRSYSPVTTIGGCVVVDPWPAPRPRRPRQLAARAVGDPKARVAAFIAAEGHRGLAEADLPIRVGIPPRDVEATVVAVAARGVVRVAGRLVPEGVVQELRRALREALAGYHREHPLEPGMPREVVRGLGEQALVEHVLSALAADGTVAVEGQTVRLVDFRAALPGGLERWADAARKALADAGSHGVEVQELVPDAPQASIRELAEFFVRQGTAVRVGRARYYQREALDRLRDEVVDEVARLGRATPAELRARTGLTRKYLIPVLEWLDASGFTVRNGDYRTLGAAAKHARRPA